MSWNGLSSLYVIIFIIIIMCIFGLRFCDISILNRFYMFVAFGCRLSERLTVVFCLLLTTMYVQIQHFIYIFGIPQWFCASYRKNCRHVYNVCCSFIFGIDNNNYSWDMSIAFYGKYKINRLRTIQYINFKMWQTMFV